MKFEIGDKVKIKNTGFQQSYFGHIEVGDIKVIQSFNAPSHPNLDPDPTHNVTFTDGTGGTGYNHLNWYMELVHRETKATNHDIWYK